jgi:hypothetical protein
MEVFAGALEYPPEVSAISAVSLGEGGAFKFPYKGSKQCALYALQNSSRRSGDATPCLETSGYPSTPAVKPSDRRARTIKLVRTRRFEGRAALRAPLDGPSRAESPSVLVTDQVAIWRLRWRRRQTWTPKSRESSQSALTDDEHLSDEMAKVRRKPYVPLKYSRYAPAGRMQGAVGTTVLRARPITLLTPLWCPFG